MQGELKEIVYMCLFRDRSRICKPQDPCMGPVGFSGNNMCFRAQLNPFVAGLTVVNKRLLSFAEVLCC